MFQSLLIANRGEIARRIMRTARRMGIRTIAVYSDADEGAAFVREADEAWWIGEAAARSSYLNIDRILEAADDSGAEAIHPGYGFLSENAAFAEATAAAGRTFVGPPPAAIRAMGLKDAAKALMEAQGVPVTPGYHGEDQSAKRLKSAAKQIGYPVLIKAVAGGGGRGMRRVDSADGFDAALESARREAAASFGDDRVLVEKFVLNPRHIEVQVFGDAHGGHVHLFERDCSLQRRRQKVIEEAPAPGMTPAVREAMTTAALNAARAVGYQNAGTVEFIVDGSGALRPDGFWFMEMNTRLQVEHPVTEMVTGLDLVEWQLRVADGWKLPPQEDIQLRGWAVEGRLCAEDPERGFLPSSGRLDVFDSSAFGDRGEGRVRLRFDSAVEEGDVVPADYDSMIAKAVAAAPTRNEALDALADGLRSLECWPLATNAALLARLLDDDTFRAGTATTSLVEERLSELTAQSEEERRLMLVAGALAQTAFASREARDPWDVRDGFRATGGSRSIAVFECLGQVSDVRVVGADDGSQVIRVDGEETLFSGRVDLVQADAAVVTGVLGDLPAAATVMRLRDRLVVFACGRAVALTAPDPSTAVEGLVGGDDVRAPMPGKILDFKVAVGDEVQAGDPVVVMEAMKMEHTLAAPRAGRIAALHGALGGQAAEGALLVSLEPEPAENGTSLPN